jgi:hypothetical protein
VGGSVGISVGSVGGGVVGSSAAIPTPTFRPATSALTSSAEAAPAAVSEAPAAITAPAAIRAIRMRVFLVIWLLPPVGHRQWCSVRGRDRGTAQWSSRFTRAPEIRMPRVSLPIFQSNVKAVATAMSRSRSFDRHSVM